MWGYDYTIDSIRETEKEPMKAYLITTATLFALMAFTHAFITYDRIGKESSDPWFVLAPALVLIISGVLSVWAFRLIRKPGQRDEP